MRVDNHPHRFLESTGKVSYEVNGLPPVVTDFEYEGLATGWRFRLFNGIVVWVYRECLERFQVEDRLSLYDELREDVLREFMIQLFLPVRDKGFTYFAWLVRCKEQGNPSPRQGWTINT